MLSFNPIPTISLGPVKMSTHGLLMAAGFVTAAILARREAKRRGLSADLTDDAVIIGLVAGFIGARIVYLLAFGQGMPFVDMLRIWEGGLSSHGGYLFGIAAGLGFLKWKKADLAAYADAIVPYVLVGWAIGRLGCFLNWDSYGAVASSWLGLGVNGETRYPTQLFESAGYLLSFGAIKLLAKSRLAASWLSGKGRAAALSLALFVLVRIAVDFVRGDIAQYLLISRIATVAVLAACVAFLFIPRKAVKDKRPAPPAVGV